MAIETPTMTPFQVVPTPDPVQMNAALMTPTTVDQSALTTPTATTVEDRLAGILNRGGPLMQQAATAGKQQAASRGLLNSSMGVQAAQAATMQAATPIAQTDAQALNQMAIQNANTLNQNLQSNANTLNQAGQFNTSTQNEFAKLNTQNQNTANQWNAQEKNEAILKTMDMNSREQLANIEANYKQLMQVNSSAENMYSQVMKNISEIQNNADISDKETAINSQMAWLRSGLTMIQNLNGVTNLVTF